MMLLAAVRSFHLRERSLDRQFLACTSRLEPETLRLLSNLETALKHIIERLLLVDRCRGNHFVIAASGEGMLVAVFEEFVGVCFALLIGRGRVGRAAEDGQLLSLVWLAHQPIKRTYCNMLIIRRV